MERRTFIALLGAASTSVLAACGSDGTTPPVADPDPSDPPPPSQTDAAPITETPITETPITEAPTTDPAESEPESPVPGDGQPILALTSEGGFTTREYAFQNPASIIVTDDGRVITLVTEPAIDSLVLAHEERTISAEGISALRSSLDEAGLFADVEYARDELLADGSTTTLVVVDEDGTEYRHEAYALATGGGLPGDPASNETDPARASLASVVSSLTSDLESIVGADTLGPTDPWMPPALQITVEGTAGADIAPDATILDWPESADLRLDDDRFVDAFACVQVADPTVIELLMSARVPTFFRDGTVDSVNDVFRVVARPAYPGRRCDA